MTITLITIIVLKHAQACTVVAASFGAYKGAERNAAGVPVATANYSDADCTAIVGQQCTEIR